MVLSVWLEVAAPSYETNMSGIIKTLIFVHLSAKSLRYKSIDTDCLHLKIDVEQTETVSIGHVSFQFI